MKYVIILSIIFVALLSGCSSNNVGVQTIGSNESTQPDVNSKPNCPSQGLQSDMQYCIKLCQLNDTDAEAVYDVCKELCNMYKYEWGTEALKELTQDFKCEKCDVCTQEQIQKKADEEKQRLANENAVEELKKQSEETQRIKEENAKIQEQQKVELEKNITLQSEKLGGYVYIKNTSGEPRQYQENGVIYEFPLQESIKVPVEIGRRLLATNQFELVIM